jgi:hypothetical protein
MATMGTGMVGVAMVGMIMGLSGLTVVMAIAIGHAPIMTMVISVSAARAVV